LLVLELLGEFEALALRVYLRPLSRRCLKLVVWGIALTDQFKAFVRWGFVKPYIQGSIICHPYHLSKIIHRLWARCWLVLVGYVVLRAPVASSTVAGKQVSRAAVVSVRLGRSLFAIKVMADRVPGLLARGHGETMQM
jgi:hypothetical protein